MNLSLYFRPISYDLGQRASIVLDPCIKKRLALIHETYTIDERLKMLCDNAYALPPIAYAFANRDITELEVLFKGLPRESFISLCKQNSKEGNPCLYYAMVHQSHASFKSILSCLQYDSKECFEIFGQTCASGKTLFQEILNSRHKHAFKNSYFPLTVKKRLLETHDKHGQTPIMHAILNKDHDVLAWLLEGLSQQEAIHVLTQRDKQGKNALYYAIKHKNKEALALMKYFNYDKCAQQRFDSSLWVTLLSSPSLIGKQETSPLALALYEEGNDYNAPTVPLRGYWSQHLYSAWHSVPSREPKKNTFFKELLSGLSNTQMYACFMRSPDTISAGFETSKNFATILQNLYKPSTIYRLCRHAMDDIMLGARCSGGLKHLLNHLGRENALAIIQNTRYSVDTLKQCPYAHDFNLTPMMVALFNQDKETLTTLLAHLDESALIQQLCILNDNHESALEITIKHCPQFLNDIFSKLSINSIHALMFESKNAQDLTMFEVGATQHEHYNTFCDSLGLLVRNRKIQDVAVQEALQKMYHDGTIFHLHEYLNIENHSKKLNNLLRILPYQGFSLRFEWLSMIAQMNQAPERTLPDEARMSLPHKLFYALLGPSYQDAMQLLTRQHGQHQTHLLNAMVIEGQYALLKGLFDELPFNAASKAGLIKAKDLNGETPFIIAAKQGNWHALKLFLDQVSPQKAVQLLYSENRARINTFMQLIHNEHTHLLSPLLEYFPPNLREQLICSREKNFYLLNYLAARGEVHLFMLVLESFDTQSKQRLLSQQDRHGKTPFLAALEAQHMDMAAAIQALGGDVFATQRAPQRQALAPIDPTPLNRHTPPAWVAPPVIIPRQDDKKPVLNNAQSSHDRQVESDAAKSAINLSRLYARYDASHAINEISHWLHENRVETTDWQTAKRAIAHLKRTPEMLMWRHQSTGITIQDALAYLWIGLSDKNAQKGVTLTSKDIEERRKRIVDTLVNMQRAYNMDGQGQDHGGKDGVTCPGGAFNMLVNGLSGAHDLVEVKIKVNDAVLSQRASVIAADLFIKMPQMHTMRALWSKEEGLSEDLWASIGAQVKAALVREFGHPYTAKINTMYEAYLQYMPPPPKVEKAYGARNNTVKRT